MEITIGRGHVSLLPMEQPDNELRTSYTSCIVPTCAHTYANAHTMPEAQRDYNPPHTHTHTHTTKTHTLRLKHKHTD